MSQNVRISAGYSDKSSADYQSRQYSISLELDVQVNGSTHEITDASDRLFDLCRRIVEKQKNVSVDNLLQNPVPSASFPSQAAPAQTPAPSNGNGSNGRAASQKQLTYIGTLGKKAGLTQEQISQLPRQYYNKASLSVLTSKEASAIIDALGEKSKAA